MNTAARQGERGDTIIEVMFAIAVFAFVAVTSMALMNQGIAITQRSLEITQVRQEINDQAELLRFTQQEYLRGDIAATATWRRLTTPGGTNFASLRASEYGLEANSRCPSNLGSTYHPFILDPKALASGTLIRTPTLGSPANATPFPQLTYNSTGGFVAAYGIWIESVPKTGGDGTKFVDFHIRACWDTVGTNVPLTLGTIVRLYEKS